MEIKEVIWFQVCLLVIWVRFTTSHTCTSSEKNRSIPIYHRIESSRVESKQLSVFLSFSGSFFHRKFLCVSQSSTCERDWMKSTYYLFYCTLYLYVQRAEQPIVPARVVRCTCIILHHFPHTNALPCFGNVPLINVSHGALMFLFASKQARRALKAREQVC